MPPRPLAALLALALAGPAIAQAPGPPAPTSAAIAAPPGSPAPSAVAAVTPAPAADPPPAATRAPAPPRYDGPDPQIVALQVALDYRVVYTGLRAELTRLGQTWGLDLVDNGSVLGDDAFDGVYSHRLVGPYARYTAVRLYGRDMTGVERLLYSGVVTTPDRHQETIAWRVAGLGGRVRAERVAVAFPGGPDTVVEGAPVTIAFAWGGLVILFVGALVRRADPR